MSDSRKIGRRIALLLINLDASEVYVPYVTSAQEPFGFGLLASEPRLKPVNLESCGRRSFACLLLMIILVSLCVSALFLLSSYLKPLDELINPSGDQRFPGRHSGFYLSFFVLLMAYLSYRSVRKWLVRTFQPTGIILSSHGFKICRRAGMLKFCSPLIEWERCVSISKSDYACHINIPGVWAPPVRLQAFDVRVSCLNFFQLLSLLPLMLGMQGRLCKGGLILPIRLDCLEGEKERLAIESAFGQVVKLKPENSTGL